MTHDILEGESTNQALARLGFTRVACDCGRHNCGGRRTVRVSDGAEALECGTSVFTANEWIRGGCEMPKGAA